MKELRTQACELLVACLDSFLIKRISELFLKINTFL
jgi:hypothetical protein